MLWNLITLPRWLRPKPKPAPPVPPLIPTVQYNGHHVVAKPVYNPAAENERSLVPITWSDALRARDFADMLEEEGAEARVIKVDGKFLVEVEQ